MRPKQMMFRDHFLEHGDAVGAYIAAGYSKKNLTEGPRWMLKQPWMIEAMARFGGKTEALVQVAGERSSLVKVKLPDVHRLENRQHRVHHLAMIASGEAEITRQVVAKGKDGFEVVEVVEKPTYTEQIAAAKLLGLMYGDFVTKTEIKETRQTSVFVKVDNGRGPVQGRVLELPENGTADFDICPHCGEALEPEQAEEHISACPEKTSEKALTPR